MNEAGQHEPTAAGRATADSAESLSLSDWFVVVTRPQPAAEQTAQVLRVAGARVLVAPMLEINALPVARPAETSFAASVFVSAAAVEHGLPALVDLDRTSLGSVLAVGAATGRRLAEKGIVDAYTPDAGEDSEALLADAKLAAVSGQAVLIVRGHSESGGRRLLADTLRARGALVTELVCYERRPTTLPAGMVTTLRDAVSEGAAVLFGSTETIESFVRAMPSSPLALSNLRLALVPHPRIADLAMRLGAQQTRLVSLADNKLVASMLLPVA